MSADEGNGLGAERLAAIFEQHTGWSEYVIDDDDAYGLHCFDCGTLICRLDALTSYERPDEDRDWEELRSRAFATHLAAVIAPEVDRLTRERDEALTVGAADGLLAAANALEVERELVGFHATQYGVTQWLRDRADALRAALDTAPASPTTDSQATRKSDLESSD